MSASQRTVGWSISESYHAWLARFRSSLSAAAKRPNLAWAVRLVLANLQGVELPAGDWTVRLVYSPASMQLGMFSVVDQRRGHTVHAGRLVLARLYRLEYGGSLPGLAKVARNSVAPIILNLFNRGIDLAFAIVMYRLLLPVPMWAFTTSPSCSSSPSIFSLTSGWTCS